MSLKSMCRILVAFVLGTGVLLLTLRAQAQDPQPQGVQPVQAAVGTAFT